MKYIAVLDTDEIEDFNFFEDGKEKYLHAIDANSVNGEWIYLPFKPLEQEPTTKNDLGVDWDELKRKIFMEVDGGTDDRWLRYGDVCDNISNSIDDFKANMPSVTPQEPQSFKWCDTCKEYDHEKHCCHRWSKVIRDIVEEMKQEQEPKPMVEIDLYSVIKQKYIEREVLDKIREQIKSHLRGVEITLDVLVENDPLRPKMEGGKRHLGRVLGAYRQGRNGGRRWRM